MTFCGEAPCGGHDSSQLPPLRIVEFVSPIQASPMSIAKVRLEWRIVPISIRMAAMQSPTFIRNSYSKPVSVKCGMDERYLAMGVPETSMQ